ncbi:sugar-binding protein [Pseudomonas sp. ADAK18]|uniref:glycosyltransferase n=1 Tax=Pseudomonas sp. ADAK18 TaxID=2730848 RepID=UPI001463BF1A|nr:glycosyltransferase [Pseudomonas sp. ADAK18]QJI29362.1 sugar-binding protein [Pseudomonas sp. ADAK18]
MNAIQPAHAHLPLTNLASLEPKQSASTLMIPQPAPPEAAISDTSSDEHDNPATLKKAFGERCNWKELAAALRTLLDEANKAFPGELSSDQQSRLEVQLASRLTTLSLPVCEDSTYYQKHKLTPANYVVSLHTYLSGSGLSAPKTLDELLALYQVAIKHIQIHPLGNFSGALSWPTPMAVQDQQAIIDLLNAPGSTLPGLPLTDKKGGALGYLLSGSNLSDNDLKKASNATETLLASAKAQALGKAIQTHLGGIATNTSVNDYLLAAIHLGLDPESLNNAARNSVAGFDLGQRQHWGKSAAAVIESLSRHLVKEGRASPPSADLAARILLARTAPEHLVKDIPPSVTYGSIPWTQLTIAAAKLEAQSPGRVLTMTYSEVLTAAEAAVDAQRIQPIQREALNNWAAVNGLLNTDPAPTDAEIRRSFITQQNAVQDISIALATPIPDREAMGLELLRKEFPGAEDRVFKVKNILKARLHEGRPGRAPGEYSMLDIVMQGDRVTHDDNEHWVTNDKRIPIQAFCDKSASGKLTVEDDFTKRYTSAIEDQVNGHTGLTKYLISTLPPEDRKNFEYGQLEFFHTNEYKIGTDFWTKSLTTKGHTLDVKITRDKQVNVYRIDTRAGTITKENYLSDGYSPPYKLETRNASTLKKTVSFNPFPDDHTEQSKEKKTVSQTPQVFDSERTNYIAKVFAHSLDLHGDDLLQHARGVTSYDKDIADNKAVRDFFLNLIPLRSAIVNFTQGNVAEGVFDLGLDVIGLLSLGTGKAAQAGKVLAKGVTSVNAASKAVRFLGTVAIEAVNPLSGAGGMLREAGGLIHSGARLGREAVNVLKGASGNYDLLKAAGTQHGLAAVGSYKVADHSLEAGAVFRDGNWYAYDVAKGKPYGAPLNDFQPRVAAAAGEVKVLDTPELLGYEVAISPDLLRVKGLQANVYVGPGNKEYIKIDGRFYQSKLKDGQRVVQHPSASRADTAVRDLGSAGWEPSVTANRLLGGHPSTPAAWKIGDNTYILPMDDVKITTGSVASIYSVKYDGTNYSVTFDSQVGAWSSGPNIDGKTRYFWRSANNKWERGTLDQLKRAKKIDAHNYSFVELTTPAILHAPKNVRPLPKDIHYFWAGGDIRDALVKNIAQNAEKMPGFKSILHVDADTPEVFQTIKAKLERDAPGMTVMNLHEDSFFQSLKTTDIYSYFRQGQGRNLAAASDVARYPLMNKYGGIYLDTDDSIKGSVGSAGLNAGDADILVGRPITHPVANEKNFYNTSNFATQMDNPVVTEMIAEMNRRFTKNKPYFEGSRPTASRNAQGSVNYTPEFLEYEGKIFETVGPMMFDDVLKSRRPDIYDLGFDGMSKERKWLHGSLLNGALFNLESDTRKYFERKGITAPHELKQHLQEAKRHYQAFREQLKIQIGGEHSWIDS